eukprot:COSAG02_NODE_2740_length_8124_cov_16.189283_2_plen_37_part_00
MDGDEHLLVLQMFRSWSPLLKNVPIPVQAARVVTGR